MEKKKEIFYSCGAFLFLNFAREYLFFCCFVFITIHFKKKKSKEITEIYIIYMKPLDKFNMNEWKRKMSEWIWTNLYGWMWMTIKEKSIKCLPWCVLCYITCMLCSHQFRSLYHIFIEKVIKVNLMMMMMDNSNRLYE